MINVTNKKKEWLEAQADYFREECIDCINHAMAAKKAGKMDDYNFWCKHHQMAAESLTYFMKAAAAAIER